VADEKPQPSHKKSHIGSVHDASIRRSWADHPQAADGFSPAYPGTPSSDPEDLSGPENPQPSD